MIFIFYFANAIKDTTHSIDSGHLPTDDNNDNFTMPFQITSEKTPDKMSKDFENFLNDMGSMVYQYKKGGTRVESNRQRWDEYSYSTSTTMPTQISMRKEVSKF